MPSEDRFGVDPFAAALAKSILKSNNPPAEPGAFMV